VIPLICVQMQNKDQMQMIDAVAAVSGPVVLLLQLIVVHRLELGRAEAEAGAGREELPALLHPIAGMHCP